jgi:hypothetical protein
MSLIVLFHLFPDVYFHFLINGRHLNLNYASMLLPGLLPKQSPERMAVFGDLLNAPNINPDPFNTVLQELNDEGEDSIRKIFQPVEIEQEGWFKHRDDPYTDADTKEDTDLLVKIYRAQAILSFDKMGIPRSRYSLYTNDENIKQVKAPIAYRSHKLEIAFMMTDEEIANLIRDDLEVWNLPGDYYKSSERRKRWRSRFEIHLSRLESEISASAPEIQDWASLLANTINKQTAWFLGASPIDFNRYIQTQTSNILFIAGQYGSFATDGKSNIFPNQFNFELQPDLSLSAFTSTPNIPKYFVPTELCKSVPSCSNLFSFEDPATWLKFRSAAPEWLVDIMYRYAARKEQIEPIFDVVAATLFASLLHAYLPGLRTSMDLLELPTSRAIRLVKDNQRINFRPAGNDQSLRVFLMPDAGEDWTIGVKEYLQKHAEQFWEMQIQIFGVRKRSALIFE